MTFAATDLFDLDATIATLAKQLQISDSQAKAAIELLQAGNTIPFIARYRKEATQGLDEIALRGVEDGLEKAQALAARKATVLKSIAEQEKLSDALRASIESTTDLQSLEAIYLPFKPKRKTRASVAREAGLGPLAEVLQKQLNLTCPKHELLTKFVSAERGVPDPDAALQGALDIVAEVWADDLNTRQALTEQAHRFGQVGSKVKRGKKSDDSKFQLYFDHHESIARAPSHRLLAMFRGEAEGVLKISLQLDDQRVINDLRRKLLRNQRFEFYTELGNTIEDCYQRLLLPTIQSTVFQTLKERADEEAIKVFGKNLHELLMAPPAGPRVTIGIDPGFRTGCKVAVVDGTGKFLNNATIYPTPPRSDHEGASKILLDLIKRYQVELIAIGNGTASRETDAFVGQLLKDNDLKITKVMVSESGASIYSASELAAKEFPDLDITVRGAISIARRLQDPLSELVKTDPKSIGVGQYQHDVNQPLLRKCLDRVVESCVNNVGVELNMASGPLLAHVAGIGPKLAENIVAYRDQHGRFRNRRELLDVPKLGKKAFEQAAGFLRIRDGDEPLDNSAVHPESYPLVSQMSAALGTSVEALVGNATLSQKLNPADFVTSKFGLPTIADIIAELAKPGRDPRDQFRVASFDDNINTIEDLKVGLILTGVITNVTHFGAFADMGVHQDGLIHISQLSDTFVKDPNEVVAVGDIVKVKVLEVDLPRKRIALKKI
ncbi:Tex family protein [Planctomycetaceae bacterium SH139]